MHHDRTSTRTSGGVDGLQGQRGALTLFSAVLILFIMALMLFYASRVSIFETRVSGNEVRQKQAFHVAEAAIDQGMMLVQRNSSRILSSQENAFPDGVGGFTAHGWLAASATRWGLCTATEIANPNHPCGGDFPAPAGSYFYDDPATVGAGIDSLPVDANGFPTGATARLSAVMCFVNIGAPAGGCLGPPTTAELEADASIVVWLLGYGYSDCTNTADVTTCLGRATVAEPISNWKNLQGPPTVPLVTKSTFPPNGTAEIVGNPDGGGVGVPLTAWINDNPACAPGAPITSSGSWQTCEYEEWYHVNEYPSGVECTDNNCYCGPSGNDVDYFMSWKKNGESAADCGGTFMNGDTCINIDMIIDPTFPCDLFLTYFGEPRANYQTIKYSATQILANCDGLGPQSYGLIWVEGDCNIAANTTVGSPTAPVILVTEGAQTRLNGGAIIFGVLYIFDYPRVQAGGTAELETLGGATVYGAVINDGSLGQFQGNFQVVHAGGVLATAAGIAGIGSVNGGWRDFGLPDIAW